MSPLTEELPWLPLKEIEAASQLLLVDSSPRFLASATVRMELDGFRCFTATSGDSAIRVCQNLPIQIIVTSHPLPDMGAEELIRKTLHYCRIRLKIVLLCRGYEKDAIKSTDCHVLTKPKSMSDLSRTIHNALVDDLRTPQQLAHSIDS